MDRGLYIVMGLLLPAFPGASSTLFVWVLAAGAAAYGASHLWRYIQGRRSGGALAGDLFLSILPAAFAGFALLWPEAVLSVLPLVLGSLLLVDGWENCRWRSPQSVTNIPTWCR